VWSRFPKNRPISSSDWSVCWRHRNMQICRGRLTGSAQTQRLSWAGHVADPHGQPPAGLVSSLIPLSVDPLRAEVRQVIGVVAVFVCYTLVILAGIFFWCSLAGRYQ